jgi:LemA protein
MTLTYLLIALSVFAVFYLISTYNWFQTSLTRIKASIQDIGNQLKRQASLIPNLESSAKGYLKHEKGIFKSLTDARKAVDTAAKSGKMSDITKASDSLSKVLPKIQVLVESNPEIKGEKVVSKLMDELRDTSDKLMYARRTLIDLSADFNQKVLVFPSNMVANLFKFKQQKGLDTPDSGEHLEVTTAETKDPKVSL